MRKALLLSLVLILVGITAVGCGDSKKVTPTTTNAFAFIQEVPSQPGLFTPMIGQYVSTGNTTRFQTAVAQDAISGQAITEALGSLYLNGNQVVFDMFGGMGDVPNNQWDIFVANVDTSVITQITDDASEDYYPQLSADGSKVVYRSYRDGDLGMTNMIVVRSVTNPLASEQVLPMPLGAYDVYDAAFSPDGTKIAVEAYGYNDIDGDFDGLVLMNADGSNPQLLTNPYAVCDCWDGYPTFTPDGSQIIFTGYTYTGSADILDLYVVNADGTGTATLLTDSVGYNLDPQIIQVPGMADKIVFSSDRDNLNATANAGFEMYSMNLDGSGLTRLTNNGLFDSFTEEWFQAPGSARIAKAGARNRHAHGLAAHGAPPMHGLKW